jgi:hypothetical protein
MAAVDASPRAIRVRVRPARVQTAPMTYSLDQIRRLCAVYLDHRPQSLASLGRRITGTSNRWVLERIMLGGGCRAATAELISDWLDLHWPPGLPWPRGLPRNQWR